METQAMKMFGLQAPIFGFSHCQDVVAAVSKAGGIGTLGTARDSVEDLEHMLGWIDEHIDSEPYGVDIMFASNTPKEFESMTSKQIMGLIPEEYWIFVDKLLRSYDVPPYSKEGKEEVIETYINEQLRTHAQAEGRLEVVYGHPKARMIVSALGVSPQHQIEKAHRFGLKVGALVGHPKHVKHHSIAGVDILISAGYEAGGHAGDIASFGLTPQIVDEASPIPVLHAGGIMRYRQIAAALALGAQGVWAGTVWLGTTEAETTPVEQNLMFSASSSETERTRCGSGKPVRRFQGGFVRAWADEVAPEPLSMPLQSVLVEQAFKKMRMHQVEGLLSPPCGQGVGMLIQQTDAREVFFNCLVNLVKPWSVWKICAKKFMMVKVLCTFYPFVSIYSAN